MVPLYPNILSDIWILNAFPVKSPFTKYIFTIRNFLPILIHGKEIYKHTGKSSYKHRPERTPSKSNGHRLTPPCTASTPCRSAVRQLQHIVEVVSPQICAAYGWCKNRVVPWPEFMATYSCDKEYSVPAKPLSSQR